MFISREAISEIQSKCDIVDVISFHIPLKKIGKNFKCLCPFHQEKTPSFVVNPDKQIFHCFGCGVGGNVFSFVMEYEKADFQEAVRILAERTGVPLKEGDAARRQVPSIRDQMFDVNEMAMKYFQKILEHPKHGQSAAAYLKERLIMDKSIESFRLGFSPNDWVGLFQAATKKEIPPLILEKAGLIIKNDTRNSHYDRFRNRLMFPILNVYNKVIGFGARALGDEMPKYVNTPETEVFSKGRHLYGLHLAKKRILEDDFVVIVEGYTDCIRLHQAGVSNCVATLGTALTSEHARLIKRYTTKILIIFDADAAGQTAMLRSLDLFLEEDMTVKIATLPEGYDPDSYVSEFGLNGFEKLHAQSKDFYQYKIDFLKRSAKTLDIHAKVRISDEMFLTIRKINNEIMRQDYLARLADDLELESSVVIAEYNTRQQKRPVKNNFQEKVAHKSKKNVAEEMLLRLMFHYPRMVGYVKEKLSPSQFMDPDLAKIGTSLIEDEAIDEHIVSRIINRLQDVHLHQLVARLSEEPFETREPKEAINDCLQRMYENFQKNKKEQLKLMIKKMEDERNYDEMNKYLKEYKILAEMQTKR